MTRYPRLSSRRHGRRGRLAWPLVFVCAAGATVWVRFKLSEPGLEARTRDRLAARRGRQDFQYQAGAVSRSGEA